MDEQTTKAIAVEMGNVARAAFTFLAPAAAVDAPERVGQAPTQAAIPTGLPLPAHVPQPIEVPAEVAVPSPVLAVPTPAIPVQSVPPAALPVPTIPVPALTDVQPERQATPPAVVPIPVPAPATGPVRSFALLNEIAFLDD